MYFETKEKLNKVKYPNLLAEYYAGWNLGALARGANVTEEIMKAVLLVEEDLTYLEKVSLSNYMCAKYGYLFSPRLSVLSKKKCKHRKWMEKLNEDMYKIWEYEKEGNKRAYDFMHGWKQKNLVNLKLWFDMSDDYYNQFVTYAAYRQVREITDYCICDIIKDYQKPRAVKISQSLSA